MHARQKLNAAYFNGSLVLATLVGIAWQSWLAFVVILACGLASSLHTREIRP